METKPHERREPCEPRELCEPCEPGFTLIEVLVASTIFIAVVTGVAHLFLSSTAANSAARSVSYATMLAMEKMEELRALPIDATALAPSPPDALRADVDGYFDAPAAGYARRWSVADLAGHAGNAIAIQVVVRRVGGPADARLATIKTRKAG